MAMLGFTFLECVKGALLGHASFVFKCLREEQIACQDSQISWDIFTLCEHVLL